MFPPSDWSSRCSPEDRAAGAHLNGKTAPEEKEGLRLTAFLEGYLDFAINLHKHAFVEHFGQHFYDQGSI